MTQRKNNFESGMKSCITHKNRGLRNRFGTLGFFKGNEITVPQSLLKADPWEADHEIRTVLLVELRKYSHINWKTIIQTLNEDLVSAHNVSTSKMGSCVPGLGFPARLSISLQIRPPVLPSLSGPLQLITVTKPLSLQLQRDSLVI